MMASSTGIYFGVRLSGVENVDAGRVRPALSRSSAGKLVSLESKATCRLSDQQSGHIGIASCGAATRNSEGGSLSLFADRFQRTQPSCGNGRLESTREKRPNATAEPLSSVPRSRCHRCGDEGAVECLTCQGSGLYVDSILESQGIIVKVKCIGCGGNGHTLCPDCGGKVAMEALTGSNGTQRN